MSEHTKTPWLIDSSKKYRVVAGKPNVDGGTMASCASYDNASSAEANADFIVRACNSHEALVKALEESRVALSYLSAGNKLDGVAYTELLTNAVAALKLAKP